MPGRVDEINVEIMQQCREQSGLALSDVKKKVSKISEIEQGTHMPTFKQLDSLSQLYSVPRWVFISDQLPEKYRFDKAVPAFRQFVAKNADIFCNPKVRNVTARVERFRNLILEMLDDMGESIASFNPPNLDEGVSPDSAAVLIRSWLGIGEERFNFSEWKKLLEDRGVFVFLTSKYKGWSYIDKVNVRGLSIYHTTLPIIIINDSDAKKAQSFTLFHELGHLLRKESAIDGWTNHSHQVEKWCDQVAGNVLMPESPFKSAVGELEGLDTVKNLAKTFKVSSYACLVRLRQLRLITQATYADYAGQLKDEYTKLQKKLKESKGGPARNRPMEVLNQYGHIYVNVLFQAYNNQEIGLHKLSKFFDLKKTSYIFDIEARL